MANGSAILAMDSAKTATAGNGLAIGWKATANGSAKPAAGGWTAAAAGIQVRYSGEPPWVLFPWPAIQAEQIDFLRVYSGAFVV
jgi:hypothetical protein